MRKLIRSPKQQSNLPPNKKNTAKNEFANNIQGKISFRCVASQHLAGDYQHPNLSYFFRSALHAYQHGMTLTYQRKNNPRKEVSFRLTEGLLAFYNSLPA
ncbi:19519_t:CDS:1, partial [Entrophospora sp. SA101]